MSSATTLYAVPLEAVQAAMGSQDMQLQEKALAVTRPKPVTGIPQATIIFLPDGSILFNDVPLAADAFRAELARPMWAGVRFRCIEKRTGDFVQRAKLSAAVLAVIQEAAAKGIMSGWEWEVPNEGAEDFSLEQAIAELIAGKLSNPDEENRYQYGYALESICHALGQHLGTIEGDILLKHLKLKTPLSRKRKPVRLPATDDAPEISYLTSDEVRQENERLRTLDLAYPKSAEIETGRREYATLVATAAEQGQAIVAFGY